MTKFRWLIAMAALLVAPNALRAQEPTIVVGTVLTPSGTPVAGAQIVAVGQARIASSNAAGAYRLSVPGFVGQVVTVRATKIGHLMQAARITLRAGTVTQNFTLSEQVASLSAIVVTGSPTGTATRREVANVVAQVPAAQIVERVPAIPNITAVLQSRIPGVQVLSQSGAEGTASRIRIRGVSSVNAGTAPIYVIDGIRMSGGTQSGFGLSGSSQSASDAIHPQDIQSIEVIKGPAAATLYGADAANGVISITTKRGEPGEQSAKINALVSYGLQNWSGRTNTNYTLCTPARIAGSGSGAVGSYPGCAGLADSTLISGDLLRDDPLALRTGHTQTLHLDATGGGANYGFYIGGNADNNSGVVFNNRFKRYSGRANVSLLASDKITTDVNIGYYRTDVT
ncbi:MAG: TonB-dependent receptor plug domain-containing protein, partial [Gemmatimonadaceae bacterium]|nr:TonB-dependent receptor plug domain-containing protein [Gemmatimonadaceae bacterium]